MQKRTEYVQYDKNYILKLNPQIIHAYIYVYMCVDTHTYTHTPLWKGPRLKKLQNVRFTFFGLMVYWWLITFLSFAFSTRRNIPGPTPSASPGKFLEMQTVRSHLKLNWEWGPGIWVLTISSDLNHTKFEKECIRAEQNTKMMKC